MSRWNLACALACMFLFAGTAKAQTAATSTRYVLNDGVKLAYEVRGEGEPLVLIPGVSQSRIAWASGGFVEKFVRDGRKVILVDPRGHGESDKPHDPAAYSSEAVADDVISVLDDLGIKRAALLGYSRGGWIAINTAIRHPDRVNFVIAGGTHPYEEDLSPFRAALSAGLEKWVDSIEDGVGSLPESARMMFLSNDPQALSAAVAVDRPDVSRALADSGVPVLLYAGTNDPRAALARKYSESFPKVEFLELPGQNHFQAFFNPEKVAQAVNARVRMARSAAAD
jgi:pimeloyl-ACP methyl ester carboxylesterase